MKHSTSLQKPAGGRLRARNMRLPILTAALALTLAGSALPESDQPNTKLKVVNDSFRWGFAPRYASLTRSFWLKPSGDDTVHIFDVVPGCSCTKSPLDKKVIPPKDSARLEIILNTGAYRGKVHKRPQIQVDGELFPHVLKIWTYAVADTQPMPRLEITPRRLDITDGQTEFTLQALNKTDSAISLRMIELWRERLEVNIPDSLAASQSAPITIKLSPPANGWFLESFTFGATTSGGEELRYTVPITFGDMPEDSTKSKHSGH